MKIFYTDHFILPLPKGHTFPIEKYALLRQRVAETPVVGPDDLCVPHAATDEEIVRAHDTRYLWRVQNGDLKPEEIRRIGFPWSQEMVERTRRSCGATIEACRAALRDGVAVSLAGGTHHAFRDHGQGYCVFNDSVVAARTMQAEGRIARAIIIDCDVHQGNGTAAIVAEDPSIFAFSIHGENNFPARKEKSDLDVALEDGTDDAAYLAALEESVRHAIELASPEMAIYLAGADPYRDDRYGRLNLSKAGLAERDRLVLSYCHAAGIPVAITMAGGCGRDIRDTVAIHFQTVRTAVDMNTGHP